MSARPAIIIATVLVAVLALPSIANAATCLPSAKEVRNAQPNAWPKWTYGPKRERCWYAGQKPVFAKARPEPTPDASPASPHPTTGAAPSDEERNAEPIKQPWALEYRWPIDESR
jgi:hypothetical protein